MHFGFSYVGVIILLMLYLPNILWTKRKPKDYDYYAKRENRVLLFFERVGEVAISALILVFEDFNFHLPLSRLPLLILAFVLMLLYELYWLRYFRSDKEMVDFYRPFLGIPVPGASLPVVAVLLIALYGSNPFLLAAGAILGVGHIGIHAIHYKETKKNTDPEGSDKDGKQ